jgi:hypothetical protein
MDEGALMERASFTFSGLLSRLLYRFNYGDTPPSPADYSNFRATENPRLSSLPFAAHPGPLKDAIADARSLKRSLLVYVYCADNPVCAMTDVLFQSAHVAEHMASKFILYATPATVAEGWALITGASFKSLPMFLFVKPTGDTLATCQIFITHQGAVSEDILVSSLESAAPSPMGDPVRAEQDRQFLEAVRQEEEHAEEAAATDEMRAIEAAVQDSEKDQVEREFHELPDLQSTDPDTCRVKFQFLDNSQRIRVFPRQGPVRMLFAFVRYYQFPNAFALEAGYPRKQIKEDEGTIEEACGGRQVQIYVVNTDW